MKERPILFSAPMIKALLEGRKTQTRRIVKPRPPAFVVAASLAHDNIWNLTNGKTVGLLNAPTKCPYGKPGDRLWVKETHAMLYQKSKCPVIAYRADDSARIVFNPPEGNFTLAGQAGEASSTWRAEKIRWRSSIHMPRWASRITLEITDVRVQRVEDISGDDAIEEGIVRIGRSAYLHGRMDGYGLQGSDPDDASRNADEAFLKLFYDINKRAKRGENPWVWALTFKVVKS